MPSGVLSTPTLKPKSVTSPGFDFLCLKRGVAPLPAAKSKIDILSFFFALDLGSCFLDCRAASNIIGAALACETALALGLGLGLDLES